MHTMTSDKKYIEIGKRLEALRLAKHPDLTIKAFSEMLGVKYTQYLNWESGLNRPLPDQVEVFCDKLGATMDFIYRGIEAALPQNTIKALSSRPRDSKKSTSKDKPD